ncbi:MAG: arginine N-succinyltransferase [Rickettsiales bacterium]
MFVRPIQIEDHAAVLELARQAGFGMTSLPPDADVLKEKIEKAVKSFAGTVEHKSDEGYLFILEDPDTGNVAGISGIKCHIGLRQPFYSYKLATITQSSQELNLFSMQKVLHAVNDYTGATEVASLFLSPEYRRDRMGRFLSRVRFLVIAEYAERFDDRVISEIRGVNDAEGKSPFYNGIARHFFQMEFKDADYLNATKGNQFITDLMPKYPIYVSLLPKSARDTIGQPNVASAPAVGLLEAEGFRWRDYVDIFDGGPTLEASRSDIKTVKESRNAEIVEIYEASRGEKFMLGTTRKLAEFRATIDRMEVKESGDKMDKIALLKRGADRLGVKEGDVIRYAKA